MTKKRLLVIDALNNFLRNYVVNPTLSRDGNPIGGLVGFLNSLQSFIRDTSPDRIIVCWDGPGGSSRRKQNDKGYKDGRKPIKMNWDSSHIGGPENVMENKIYQMSNLYQLIDLLPITNLLIDAVEADDIISYVVQMNHFADWQKVIISADKDFVQLIGKDTILLRPIQKEILTIKKVVADYNVHPNNFLLARSVCGDKSDNLSGIEGVGIPTLAKRFPFLMEEKQHNIKDLLDYCEKEIENKTKIKAYHNILDNKEKIEHNYSMMQLVIPKIPVGETRRIQEDIKNKKLTFQKTEFIKMMNKVGFSMNIDTFTQNANRLTFDK